MAETLREVGVASGNVGLDSLSFAVDPARTGIDPASEDGVAAATAVSREGTVTGLGLVSASTDILEMTLFVQSERDDSYTVVESKAGGDTLLVDDDGVTIQGCS